MLQPNTFIVSRHKSGKQTEEKDHIFDLVRLLEPKAPKGGHLFVLVCYLDDSDNKHGPAMGLAGYIGRLSTWAKFETDVELVLEKYGVSVIRGLNFHHGKDCFRGWLPEQKSQFIGELYSLVANHSIRGFATTVYKDFYSTMRLKDSRFKNISQLCLAFSSVISDIIYKDLPSFARPGEKVSFVIELGNSSNANVLRYFEQFKRDLPVGIPNTLGSMSFVDKHSCRAIQLADFLAFHARREADAWAAANHETFEYQGSAMQQMTALVKHRFSRLYREIGHSDITGPPPDHLGFVTVHRSGLR